MGCHLQVHTVGAGTTGKCGRSRRLPGTCRGSVLEITCTRALSRGLGSSDECGWYGESSRLTAKGRFPEAVAEQPDCKLKTGMRMGKSSSFELSVCWVDSRIYM